MGFDELDDLNEAYKGLAIFATNLEEDNIDMREALTWAMRVLTMYQGYWSDTVYVDYEKYSKVLNRRFEGE